MERIDEKQSPTVLSSDTENATKIEPDDAPPHNRRKYENFRKYNTGMWNGPKRENTEQFRRQDDLHRYDAVSSSIGLTEHQQSRGRSILDDLDFQAIGMPIDHIIFGVCVIVANADVVDGYRYYPDDCARNTDDDPFPSVADDLGLSLKDQQSILQRLRDEVDV